MISKDIQIYSDSSRMELDGQLYNCTDGDFDGFFRNSITGATVLVSKYTFNDEGVFNDLKRIIDDIEPDAVGVKSKSELSEIEEDNMKSFNSDERLYGVVCPYAFGLQSDSNGKDITVYTISNISDDFRTKFRTFKNAVFDPELSINLRISVIFNFLNLLIALIEKIGNVIRTINLDAVLINVDNGEIKLLLDKLIFYQGIYLGNTLSESIAYLFFEVLCMANPYDGKKTLVDVPLITKKTESVINIERKEFIFANNGNGITNSIGKDTLAKWNALPLTMKVALYDNLCGSKTTISYSIADWLKVVRKLRDLLVFENGHYCFCQLSENARGSFFLIDDYKIPIMPRKAIYGYHVGEVDFILSKRVVLGVIQDKKVFNYSDDIIKIEKNEKVEEISPGSTFMPESGMKIYVKNKLIKID